MQDKYKHISLIIALKRKKNNSIIFKRPKYVLCKEFNLSVNTFSKLLKECIEEGYIEDCGNHWRVIRFTEVIKRVLDGTGLYFAKHNMIGGDIFHDYKDILKKVEEFMVYDNVCQRQLYRINKKQNLINGLKSLNGTEKKARAGFYKLDCKTRKKVVKLASKHGVQEGDFKKAMNFENKVVTSARHTASVVGFSISKANKILNGAKFFKRKVLVKWYKGCSEGLYDQLRKDNPKAAVIPLPYYNKIKVASGSELVCL